MTSIKTKQSAMENGEKRYFTGLPCRNGHFSERLVSNEICRECKKKVTKKYYDANKEKCDKKLKEYIKNNPNKRKETNTNYKKRNKKKIDEYNKKWVEKKRKTINEQARKRAAEGYKNNPQKYLAYSRKRRAKKKSIGGEHTDEQIYNLLKKQKNKCINCKKNISNKFDADHVMPIRLGGSNDIGNIQLLCITCNRKKSAKDPIKWAQENGRLL